MFDSPDETPLARSPLVTVVWQLRTDEHPGRVQPEKVLQVQTALGGPEEFSLSALPRIQVVAQAGSSVEAAPPAPVLGTGGGWRLSAQDRSWHVNIEPSSVSIEASVYGTWDDQFNPKIKRVLQAVASVARPVIEMRLGLRYVNLVFGGALQRGPFRGASEFEGVLEPAVLGIIGDPELRQYAQVVQGRFSLNFDDIKAIVNHGVVSAESGELGYLLDIDVFREGARQYSEEEAAEATGDLHRVALGLFRSLLSPEAVQRMTDTNVSDSAPSP